MGERKKKKNERVLCAANDRIVECWLLGLTGTSTGDRLALFGWARGVLATGLGRRCYLVVPFFSVRVFCAVSKKVELKPHLPPLVTRHTLAGVGQVGPFAHAMVAGTLMRRSGWLPFMQPL